MQALQRPLTLFSSLLFLCLVSLALEPQKPDLQPTPAADVTKITFTATVLDRGLRVVTDLKAEDFTLFENGRPQPIQSVTFNDMPACVGVLVDRSGSMRSRLREATDAVMDLVRAGHPENQYFIVNFNNEPYLDQELTRDKKLIEQALERGEARGGTALYATVIAAADHLARAGQCSRRALVIFSDGEDNSSRKTLEQAVAAIRSAGNPVVYAIGLPNEHMQQYQNSRHALQTLAIPTGGIVFFGSDFKEIGRMTHWAAEELRSQYSVTYAPVNVHSKGSRNLKLVARADGGKSLEVRMNVATTIERPGIAPIK
jgi:Ca-activated chloride channel family protein